MGRGHKLEEWWRSMLKLIREPGNQVLVPLPRGEERDKKFEQVIRWYPEFQAEMTAKGTIILRAPGGLESGKDSGEAFALLFVWIDPSTQNAYVYSKRGGGLVEARSETRARTSTAPIRWKGSEWIWLNYGRIGKRLTRSDGSPRMHKSGIQGQVSNRKGYQEQFANKMKL